LKCIVVGKEEVEKLTHKTAGPHFLRCPTGAALLDMGSRSPWPSEFMVLPEIFSQSWYTFSVPCAPPAALTKVSKGNDAKERPKTDFTHCMDLLLPIVWNCCLVTRRVWLGFQES
jgi:hypothetical protein